MEVKKEDILQQLDHPARLEQLYRADKSAFRRAFREAYVESEGHPVARTWHERLEYVSESSITWGSASEWWRIILICLVSGTLAKLPDMFSMNESLFFERNTTFLVFPFLVIYFSWKNGYRLNKLLTIAALFVAATVYMNALPVRAGSDTIVLALIFMPIFAWSLLGFAFSGKGGYDHRNRLDFLKYNGDFFVMSGILLLSFGLFSALTIGLFHVVGVDIEKYYSDYFAIYCVFAAPLIGTHLVRTNPQLVNKVSPVIAKVFTPLLLLTLVGYLIAFAVSDKDPYNDRDFLFNFNMLLLGVMAIVFFSVAEIAHGESSRFSGWSLFLLSLTSVVVNVVATSAIAYRLFTMGITPNRLVVTGSNLLLLSSATVLTARLFAALKENKKMEAVPYGITLFLPAIGVWAFIVACIFPLLFGYR